MAKARQYPCPAGGYLQARTDLVTRQFGELLRGLRLPPYWREMIREQMLEAAKKQGLDYGFSLTSVDPLHFPL